MAPWGTYLWNDPRISQIFHILNINKMISFSTLPTGRPSYITEVSGSVYRLCGNDVSSLVLVEPSDALHRNVITLGRSACENYLLRVGFYQLRYLLQRV